MVNSLGNVLKLCLLAAVCTLILTQSAAAQVTNPLASKQAESAEPTAVPDPLTQEAIRDLLSTLDDKQVRALLLKRLSAQADARAAALAEQDNRSLPQILAGYGDAFTTSLAATISKAGELPDHIAAAAAQFSERRQGDSVWNFVLALLFSIAGGLAIAIAVRRASAAYEESVVASTPRSLWHKFGLLVQRFLLQLVRVITFFVVASGICLIATKSGSPDRYTVQLVIRSMAWVGLIVAMARFVLAPTRPALRLCPFDDATASFLLECGARLL